MRNSNLKSLGEEVRSTFVINLPEYEHITLTDHEKEAALRIFSSRNHRGEIGFTIDDLTAGEKAEAWREARGIKQGRITEAAYAKKVNDAPKEFKLTPEFLYEGLRIKYTNEKGVFVETMDRDKIYKDLCYYFSYDSRYSGDLKKGLLIQGNVGCGKTSMLEYFRKSQRKYSIVTCSKLSYEYKTIGVHVVAHYGKNHDNWQDVGVCFDDLGMEPEMGNYGDKLNIMTEVLLRRYETRAKNTILTTNLTLEQIEAGYGKRVADRMKEMFNQVALPGGSLR